MTEINGNFTNFGINTGKVEPKKEKEVKKQEIGSQEGGNNQEYIQDTGVLGRSQIVKTGDISKSVDEAAALAQTHPEVLTAANLVFEDTYNYFIGQGMSEDEAYISALEAQAEFMDIAV